MTASSRLPQESFVEPWQIVLIVLVLAVAAITGLVKLLRRR